MAKAKGLYDGKYKIDKTVNAGEEFKVSCGWLEKFFTRNGLCFRRKTTEAQKDLSHLVDILVSYVLQIRRLKRTFNYADANAIAMDETAVLKDMLSSTTVDKVGSKTVSIKTTGQEQEKVTVCLAAKADGTKFKLFMVFTAGKRECAALNKQFRDKCIIKSNVNGWMNEQLTEEWIDSVVGRSQFGRRPSLD